MCRLDEVHVFHVETNQMETFRVINQSLTAGAGSLNHVIIRIIIIINII